MKRLGIIGGMGPAATADLFARVVDMTDVDTDQEHIDIVVLNDPTVPDRTSFILGKDASPSFVPPLQDKAKQLEEMGCDVLVMPCNAAHVRHEEIASVLKHAKLLNILKETASLANSLGCGCAGILATDGSIESGAYQRAFEGALMTSVVPDAEDQRLVMSAIYDYVKAGRKAPMGYLDAVCDHLIEKGADCLILGCTELSLLGIDRVYDGVPVIDSMDALAYASVLACDYPVKDILSEYC